MRNRMRRGAIAVALGFVLAVPAVLAASQAPAPAAPPAAAPPAPGRGQELYQQNCASCHGPSGEGTDRGPRLVGVGPAAVDFQLSTGRMPLTTEEQQPERAAPKFAPADIRSLVDYVASFGGGGPAIPDVRPGDVSAGEYLFLANCASCHSSTGTGSTLTGGYRAPDLYQATPVQIAEAMRTGPGRMPRFADTALTNEEVNAIASYVGTLQNKHGDLDQGGVSMDRIGPVTEGLVGWGLGLLLIVLFVRWLGSRARDE